MAPKLLTVKDLAAMFQKDEETIRTWIRERVFPGAFKIKEGWYVPASDIKKMIKKNGDESGEVESAPRRTQRPSAGFVNGWK